MVSFVQEGSKKWSRKRFSRCLQAKFCWPSYCSTFCPFQEPLWTLNSMSPHAKLARKVGPLWHYLKVSLITSRFYRKNNSRLFLGQVRGSLEKSNNGDLYAQFLGLRYARAPVGELRFARPKPVTKSWNGTVKEATKQAPKCVQFDKVSGEVVGKEDCLFVNIYVPSKLEKVFGVFACTAFSSQEAR